MVCKDYGALIKKSMEDRNLKQKDVARELNISPQTMSNYVNNKRLPQLDCFLKMIELLDLSDIIFNSHIDNDYIEKALLEKIPKLDNDQKHLLFMIIRYFDKSDKK